MARMRRVKAGVALMGVGALAVVASPALGQAPEPTPAPPETPAPTTPPATALPPGVIAPGVKIAGVDVGGLTRAAAKKAVLSEHVAPRRKPVVAVFRGKRVAISPVAVGYVAVVPAAKLAAHEAAVRREGFASYRVHPDSPRDVYLPIHYVDPFEGRNLRAFGYDMTTEPVRREAIERARDSGAATLSGRVALLQDDSERKVPGFLLYVRSVGSGVTLLAYCLWAFEKADLADSSIPWFQLSIIPFVLVILRYALILETERVRGPEEILLQDRLLQVFAVVWAGVFAAGVYLGHAPPLASRRPSVGRIARPCFRSNVASSPT